MRLTGKRFWTWISVAVLSVFVKGEGGALAQEQSTTNNPSSSTQLKHNVPPHVPKSKTKVVDKLGTSNASKVSGSTFQKTTLVGEKGTGSSSFKQDASSKDASKITFKSGFKTTPAVGEKRDLTAQSGVKTSNSKSGEDDNPTESITKLKHHGSRKPK